MSRDKISYKYNNNFNEHKENINDKCLNFKNDSTFIKF